MTKIGDANSANNSKLPEKRKGTALGGAVHLRLPEMAVSFARGAVIQAWLRQDRLQNAPIVELSQAAGVGRIALVCRQAAVELQWHDASGTLYTATSKPCLDVGAWVHITVVLGVDGVVFYRNGSVLDAAKLPATTPAALEAARACNYIGEGAQPGDVAFAGAVADVRLWNRSAGHDAIVARYARALRGDEAGLCGWWTLEGADGSRDRSCFARHATLVGGPMQPAPASFDQAPSRDTHALDLGRGTGTIEIGAFELTGTGFTWQATLRARDTSKAMLLRLGSQVAIGIVDNTLRCQIAGQLLAVPIAIRPNTWVALALRQSVDGMLTAYVDGAPVGKPVAAAVLPRGTYTATVAQLDGEMAELRLWSRGLSGAELADTTKRRIHGWAPGLIGCWRMDDEQLSYRPALLATICDDRDFGGASKSLAVGRYDFTALGIGNDRLSSLRVPLGLKVTLYEHGGFTGKSWTYTSDCALVSANDQASSVVVEALPVLVNADPSGPVAVVSGATPAPRGDLAFGVAPPVAPPRVAGFTGSEKLTLPGLPKIGEQGISLQLWVRPDRLTDATFLSLGDSSKSAEAGQKIALASTAGGDLTLAYSDVLWLQKPRVEGMFAASTWTQLSVTIGVDGVMCIYRDGRQVAREEHDAPRVAALDSFVLGAGFVGCIGELRVWSRALSAREIEQNWRRRISSGAGLAARWALAGDLAGVPAPASGAPIWREAPALALTEGPPVRVATVTAKASLVADQTGGGARPDLVIDLRATDAAGRPQVGVELTVVLDKAADVHRGTTLSPKLVLGGKQGRTLTIKTGAGGRVRLAMPATGLLAPIFRVRHAGMADGEWALVTPDQVIHQALASLTHQELTRGRKATSATRAGTRGLVAADSEKLLKVLRGMMGAAAAFSFEEQSTAALAFGDDAEAAPGAPLVAGHGGNFRVDEDAPLVRRLGAALVPDSATMPESFGGWDDLCSFVVKTSNVVVDTGKAVGNVVVDAGKAVGSAVVNTGKAVASVAVDTVEAVGKGVVAATKVVVESIEVHVKMMIAGAEVVVNAVMKTVEDIVAATVKVFAAIGKSVLEVLDFLADLFDWSDILATADLMLRELTRSITAVETGITRVFTDLQASIREIEAQALTALGGQASVPASAGEAREEVAEAEEPETPGLLDYLLALLPDDLEKTIQQFRKIFDPITSVLSGALGRLTTLGDGLASEWNDPALQAALKDPRKFLDSDPADLLAIARLMLRVVINGTVLVVDFVGDLAVAIVQSFKRLIDLHLNIPIFTDFVEKYILKGRKLTVGIMLCLIPAIPTTVLYKAITGHKDGPAALAKAGPRSFGGDDDGVDYLDILLRGMNLVCTAICGTIDSIEAALGEDVMKPWAWPKWGVGGVSVMVGVAGLVKDGFGDDRDSRTQRAKYGLDIASGAVGFVGWIAGGISLWAQNEGTKEIAGWVDNGCGVFGDGCGLVSGILDVALNVSDDEASKTDAAIASLDLAATVGSLAASLAGLIPDQSKNPEPISKSTLATLKVLGTAGGNTLSGGAQLAALSLVIVASVA